MPLALEHKRPNRTNPCALAAVPAPRLRQRPVSECRDPPLQAPSCKADGSDAEAVPAHPHAPSAQDTLVCVIEHCRTARIDGEVALELPESFRFQFDPEVPRDFLELAGSVLRAAAAIHGMF